MSLGWALRRPIRPSATRKNKCDLDSIAERSGTDRKKPLRSYACASNPQYTWLSTRVAGHEPLRSQTERLPARPDAHASNRMETAITIRAARATVRVFRIQQRYGFSLVQVARTGHANLTAFFGSDTGPAARAKNHPHKQESQTFAHHLSYLYSTKVRIFRHSSHALR